MTDALLVLEDGTVFEGTGFGAAPSAARQAAPPTNAGPAAAGRSAGHVTAAGLSAGHVTAAGLSAAAPAADGLSAGEVVFNTGMTGYQEVLTDPSYAGQIVTMTYPHIGNYGVVAADEEGRRPHAAGFVIRDLAVRWSSWRATGSLDEYLTAWGVPGIAEVDTRRLTRHLRAAGAMRGAIAPGDADPAAVSTALQGYPSMTGADFVRTVTATEPHEWAPAPGDPPARLRVAAYDFGIKTSILRQLTAHGCAVTVYPASTPAAELLGSGADGVFLSNGPGDPEAVGYGIAAIRSLVGQIPVFGICLGHQLLGLSLGLETFKLAFGHHGVNHPVARLADGQVEITTQNHGFAVRAEAFGFAAPDAPGGALPAGLTADTPHGKVELTHVNLNDYTVEGFRLLDEPAFAVQYHPEAGPGPHDALYLFDTFSQLMNGSPR